MAIAAAAYAAWKKYTGGAVQRQAQVNAYRSLFDDAPIAIHEIDRNGVICRVNKAECELLGKPVHEMLGRPVWELVVPEQQELSRQEVLRKVREGRRSEPFVRTYNGPGANPVVLEIHERLIFDSDGKVSRIRAALLDISARVRAEEQNMRLTAELEERVRERTAELEKSNEALQQFAYSASHDLQEPLRMVSSYAQLLNRRYRDAFDEDSREYLFYVVDGAERMSRLIRDLLAFSRVNAPNEEELASVDMNDIVKIAIRNLESAIEESGALITAVTDLPILRARPAGLAQVVQNLLSNSIKYRSLTLPPQVQLSCCENADDFTFCIEDNGLGFDQVHAERAFGVFKRLHGRSYPGTGMGLAICKRIVERYGGRIWAESEAGKGSKFWFTIRKVSSDPKRQ